jgi:hypothetical protein
MNKPKTCVELIKNAEDKYRKNSSLAEFWRKAKEEALIVCGIQLECLVIRF